MLAQDKILEVAHEMAYQVTKLHFLEQGKYEENVDPDEWDMYEWDSFNKIMNVADACQR